MHKYDETSYTSQIQAFATSKQLSNLSLQELENAKSFEMLTHPHHTMTSDDLAVLHFRYF